MTRAIPVDVAEQNCIFKNVTQHLWLYKMGKRMANAMNDCRKQQPQLMMTIIGRYDGLTTGVCNKFKQKSGVTA